MKHLGLLLLIPGISVQLAAQDCDSVLFPGGKQYYDTYHGVAGDISSWKHFNTHDPTVNRQGDWYYMYSTDASWGNIHHTGALKRRSKDLVNWEFLGNAFDGVPESAADFFRSTYNPDYTDDGIWAPFLLRLGDRYILYYCAPGGLTNVNLAFIGYAVSDSAGGPWQDMGKITTSHPGDSINAIDPTVIYDSVGKKLWMAYGSWHTGIYMLELDPETGGIRTAGDRGVKIAGRAGPGYGIEGPELVCRNGWYYLFVSYDPLGDLYNVRVGRSRNPTGPFLDFTGKDMKGTSDNIPMILAPYRFDNHFGWQGTGHCAVYRDGGQYYLFCQGRPSIEPAMMVLHVRKIFWLDDWPVLSPERYAGMDNCGITPDSVPGQWEHMPLIYHNSASGNYRSTSSVLDLSPDGTFDEDEQNAWSLDGDTLSLDWSGGEHQELIVFRGWDWENSCPTLMYTGLNDNGRCIWGKRINRKAVENFTQIINGAGYTIRNANSHLLMQVPGTSPGSGTSVRQGDGTNAGPVTWKVKDAGLGYHFLLTRSGYETHALEVRNGDNYNGADLIIADPNGSDRQKFRLEYNDNGFFRIMTKASNGTSCADVEGFSVVEGGNIFQWEYLGGLNQQWRFRRDEKAGIDPYPLSVDQDRLNGDGACAFSILPNPGRNGHTLIGITGMESGAEFRLSVTDPNGLEVFSRSGPMAGDVRIELQLKKGFYLIRLDTADGTCVRKLVMD